jgi:ribonucleotide reductase alpha subunit
MKKQAFDQEIVEIVWNDKYRYKLPDGSSEEATPTQSKMRMVKGVYARDPNKIKVQEAVSACVGDFLIPGGRVAAGAGTSKRVTWINCFVNQTVDDSMEGIMAAITEAALTQQQGGGIGTDFSTLRPNGAIVKRTGSVSTGPLPFMDMWHAMCQTIKSSGSRRGAMMGTLADWHPDLPSFIVAKQEKGRLTNFNVSVLISDNLMKAIQDDSTWDLGFHVPPADPSRIVDTYEKENKPWYVYQRLKAKELWDMIIKNTYDWAEPGVIFIDRINRMNNLYYCEDIRCVNPCVTGDTKILVAGRGAIAIKQLAEEGKDVPVFAYDFSTDETVVRWGRNPRLTRRNAELVKVTLDDGSNFRCTPDHKVYSKFGTKLAAKDLKPGFSLRRVDHHAAPNNEIFVNSRLEYHLIAESKYACKFNWGTRRGEYHTHHVNENHFDNSWDNIEVKLAEEHNSDHKLGDNNPMRFWWNGRTDEEKKEEVPANHKVVSVEHLIETEDVYNITVDKLHNYFIITKEESENCKSQKTGVLQANCGEQNLPPRGDCNLIHNNLSKMVDHPFSDDAKFNYDLLRSTTRTAMRFADNVIDTSPYPIQEQYEEAQAKRRVGLGYSGLANAMQMLQVRYGHKNSIGMTESIGQVMRDAAYWESVELAKERGPFPMFDKDKYMKGEFIKTLPADLQDAIAQYGIRNGVLLTLAPVGTGSLYHGNISSGLEPTIFWKAERKLLMPDNTYNSFEVTDYGYLEYCKHFGKTDVSDLPYYMVTANDLTVEEHLSIQATAQNYIDASISKTLNCPADMPYESFKQVYRAAYDLGCKGCTTYRPSGVRGAVITEKKAKLDLSPIKRPNVLPATVYKVKMPGVDQAFYLTISDYTDSEGVIRPFEIFINSKSVRHLEWTTALTRTISAIFRRGGDITFLIEELSEVYSITGGGFKDGKYVPSLVALIGDTIKTHLQKLALLPEDVKKPVTTMEAEICPHCQQKAFYHMEGCDKCSSCGFSNCG